jgi:hypothetical protein
MSVARQEAMVPVIELFRTVPEAKIGVLAVLAVNLVKEKIEMAETAIREAIGTINDRYEQHSNSIDTIAKRLHDLEVAASPPLLPQSVAILGTPVFPSVSSAGGSKRVQLGTGVEYIGSVTADDEPNGEGSLHFDSFRQTVSIKGTFVGGSLLLNKPITLILGEDGESSFSFPVSSDKGLSVKVFPEFNYLATTKKEGKVSTVVMKQLAGDDREIVWRFSDDLGQVYFGEQLFGDIRNGSGFFITPVGEVISAKYDKGTIIEQVVI